MVDFKFYLNRQGPRGQQGEQGEQGFSPSITINSNTASEFTLLVTNENDSFVTPNLRADQVTDMGGTYIRYNPETRQMYAGYADTASDTQRGEVLLATDEDIELGTSGVVVTADQLRNALDAAIEQAGGDVEALRTEMQIAIGDLTASISTETTQRTLADNALSARIDSEVSTRVSADTALSDRIDSIVIPDVSNFATKDELAEVEAEIPDVSSFLTTTDVSTVALTGDYDDLLNKPSIPDVSNLATKSELSTEITERTNADTSLATSISTVASSIPDVSGFATTTQLSQEASTRSSEDTRLEGLINSITVPTVNDPTITFNYGTTPIGEFTLNQSTTETITIPEVTVNTATSSTPGIVQPDNTSIVINNGVISATAQTPTQATSTTLGIVKPDNNTIVVDANGVISATASGGVQIDDTTTTTNATWSSEKINTSIQVGDEAVLETVMESFIANDGLVAGDGISLISTTTTTGATQITIENSQSSGSLKLEGYDAFYGSVISSIDSISNVGCPGTVRVDFNSKDYMPSTNNFAFQFRFSSKNSTLGTQNAYGQLAFFTEGMFLVMEQSTPNIHCWNGSSFENYGSLPFPDYSTENPSIMTWRFEFNGTQIKGLSKLDGDQSFTTQFTATMSKAVNPSHMQLQLLGINQVNRSCQMTIYHEGTFIEDLTDNTIVWQPKVTGLVDATISEFTEVNPTAKEQIMSWSQPDWSGNINIINSFPYTCPSKGFLYITNWNGYLELTSNLNSIPDGYKVAGTSQATNVSLFPVEKNEVLTLGGTNGSSKAYFVPMKGVD